MKKFVKNIIACMLLGASTISCTSDFEEMNKPPFQPSEVEPELIFPFVCREVPNLRWDAYQCGDNLHANMFAQYIANTSMNFSHDRYQYNDEADYGYWEPHFLYVMKNVQVVGDMIDKYPLSQYTYQLMRILRAMSTAKTTDLFGDIPHSEAGKGNEHPKYDSQKDIYYWIFNELDEAVSILNSGLKGQKKLGKSDFIFEGDFSKWIKMANSFRLRCALRISFIEPEKAKEEGEKALQGGVMESIDDRATTVTNTADWRTYGYPLITICHWNEFRMSATMERIMKVTSTVEDPRLPVIWGQTKAFSQGEGPKFKGIPNGMPADRLESNEYSTDKFSNVYGLQFFPTWNMDNVEPQGGQWLSKRFPVMNYSEVCFLKAEASIRGWKRAGNAKENYEKGIRASFEENRTGVEAKYIDYSNDDTYITTGKAAWDEGADFETKLEKIITQKWICLFPNGNEAWSEFRRTGYPKLTPIVKSDNPNISPENGEFIKKIMYVDEERRNNKENCENPSLNQGQGDGGHVRVWWDTKRYK